MMIASAEGMVSRYEVILQSDGYLVQTRVINTGEVLKGEFTLFRSASAAMAYAGMVAAAERCAVARLWDDEDDGLREEFAEESRRFALARAAFADVGVDGEDIRKNRKARSKTLLH